MIFHLHFDYMVDDNTDPTMDHWEFTPGFSLGIKTSFTNDPHGIAGGIEMFGGFSGGVSVLAGVYFPIGAENLIFKNRT